MSIDDPFDDGGVLQKAFEIDGEKTADSGSSELKGDSEEKKDEVEKDADSFGGRYPYDGVAEAEESMERARKNESKEAFKKIASEIVEKHPELASEKLAGVGYKVGQQIAQGIKDELRSNPD